MVLTMDQRQQRPRREAQACARGDRASNSLILDELVELPCRDMRSPVNFGQLIPMILCCFVRFLPGLFDFVRCAVTDRGVEPS